jgi:hypothetical protein
VDFLREYRAKLSREAAAVAEAALREGLPKPAGDPGSGIVIVMETPPDPAQTEAMEKSLQAIHLQQAYLTWNPADLLRREILFVEPVALVAVGPGPARRIDEMAYPLARSTFREAGEGAWFRWSRNTAGMRLPPLGPALTDEAAKRKFWAAFLSLQPLGKPR